MKKIFKVIFLVLFFFFGLGLSLVSSQKKSQTQNQAKNNGQLVEDEVISWPRYTIQEETTEAVSSMGNAVATNKFTIVQTQSMVVDKTKAQTGEQVHFTTKIKNQGSVMKHLTNVCFNHSGGVTFGCLNGPQGPNLDPGQEMEISNTAVFTLPGTYYVWLTWSQDATNFYQPQGSTSVQVVIE